MTADTSALSVKCPHCQRPVRWTDDYPFKPFCCERCKMIDLGEWAAEEKKIPGETIIDQDYPDEGKLH
ncbi:MAG: DNA gyrase inhibitor YacG [Gammaproteobacteria bacterium HGW-Gammaproteobacteria-3]|nr:MAG: DNA gyrase inhibitor YacG [Gammaproteobacteria bacterium HGW-Gammaproteobacteria-3]